MIAVGDVAQCIIARQALQVKDFGGRDAALPILLHQQAGLLVLGGHGGIFFLPALGLESFYLCLIPLHGRVPGAGMHVAMRRKLALDGLPVAIFGKFQDGAFAPLA